MASLRSGVRAPYPPPVYKTGHGLKGRGRSFFIAVSPSRPFRGLGLSHFVPTEYVPVRFLLTRLEKPHRIRCSRRLQFFSRLQLRKKSGIRKAGAETGRKWPQNRAADRFGLHGALNQRKMRTFLRISYVFGIFSLGLALPGQDDPLAKGREALGQPCLLVAHVEGDITPSLVDGVRAEVRQWIKDRPAIKFIVFQIHTRGGVAFSAQDLAHFIHTELKDFRTISFIPPGKHALSAGALIAVSAKEIVMGSDSRMGAAAPVLETEPGRMEELGEKEQSLIRSYFRSYAEDAGYRTLLTDAMVSKDHEDILKVTLIRTRGNVSEERPEFCTRRDYDNMPPEVKATRKGDPEVILPKGRLLVIHERE